MPKRLTRIATFLIPAALVVGYVSYMGSTGRCAMCEVVVDSAVMLTGFQVDEPADAALEKSEAAEPGSVEKSEKPKTEAQKSAQDFRRIARPGSVDIAETYDMSDPQIPTDEIHTLLPKDAIPALTDPETMPAADADWLPDHARIIVVTAGEGDDEQTVGVPIVILNWHEIVNMTVGGEPVAATYCPLCDSVTVFSRRLPAEVEGEEPTVLEFGVSGALYNSNVLMFDREGLGLWSQIAMRAVTGKRAGTSLEMMPLRMLSFEAFKEAHPGAHIVSNNTGHERDYNWENRPYQGFFSNDRTLVPLRKMGQILPKKTLGVGVSVGSKAWFVTDAALAEGDRTIETDRGPVVVSRTDAGVFVKAAPKGVRTVQAFYYAWSAFYPDTRVIGKTE